MDTFYVLGTGEELFGLTHTSMVFAPAQKRWASTGCPKKMVVQQVDCCLAAVVVVDNQLDLTIMDILRETMGTSFTSSWKVQPV